MKILTEFATAIETGKVPQSLHSRVGELEAHYQRFTQYRQATGNLVYGLDTLTGHRDSDLIDRSPQAFGQYLLRNHAIGGAPFFSGDFARAISLAKIYSFSNNGPIVSSRTFSALLDAFEDQGFAPEIPLDCSYSSGDVIPAAHWALAVSGHGNVASSLQPGEAMTLINGAFVHVGATAALLMRVRNIWPRIVTGLINSLHTLDVDAGSLAHRPDQSVSKTLKTMSMVALHLPSENIRASQLPVSIRATGQILDGLVTALEGLANQLAIVLPQPSCNPLFDDDLNRDVSNASFVCPSLSIQTGAVIDAILMYAWASGERCKHMLGGEIAGLPRDGQTSDNPIALIQWPKMAQAKLESMRHRYANRVFTTGSTTSYGVEDFWSHGTNTCVMADKALADLEEILSIEHLCSAHQQQASKAQISGTGNNPVMQQTIDDARRLWSGLDDSPLRSEVEFLF